MSKPPSFQFYPGDRLQELLPILNDNEAVGAWLKAVMYLWSHGPSDAERLGLAVGSGWERVGFLFSGKDGLMMLEWMEEMRAERAAFVARQRSNGRRGGRPKARNVAGKNPSLSSGITQKKPRKSPRVEDEDEDEVEDEGQNLEKKGTREVAEIWPSFADWWKLYAKGSRKLSAEAWERLSQADREAAMAATPPYLQSRPEVKYRKDGERFLKNRTWEDPIIQNNDTSKPHQLSEAEKLAAVLALAESRRAAAPLVDQDGHPDGWGEQP